MGQEAEAEMTRQGFPPSQRSGFSVANAFAYYSWDPDEDNRWITLWAKREGYLLTRGGSTRCANATLEQALTLLRRELFDKQPVDTSCN
jgi:hypothetical protein